MADPILTPDIVRGYLKDIPELNTLLDQRWSDGEIETAINLAIDSFNTLPPLTGNVDIYTFPSQSLLLLGTVWHLCEMASLHETSNQFAYNAGGLSIQDKDKGGAYQSLAEKYRQLFERNATRIKYAVNTKQGWGFIP